MNSDLTQMKARKLLIRRVDASAIDIHFGLRGDLAHVWAVGRLYKNELKRLRRLREIEDGARSCASLSLSVSGFRS